jgi:hypothetical protein
MEYPTDNWPKQTLFLVRNALENGYGGADPVILEQIDGDDSLFGSGAYRDLLSQACGDCREVVRRIAEVSGMDESGLKQYFISNLGKEARARKFVFSSILRSRVFTDPDSMDLRIRMSERCARHHDGCCFDQLVPKQSDREQSPGDYPTV